MDQAEWTETIQREVREHLVCIFAKGEKRMAVCGFSHGVMEVFDRIGVEYHVRNVLTDPNLLPALCAFSHWPTVPQVFIGGRFVGGCDVVTELHESGELQKLLHEAEPRRA